MIFGKHYANIAFAFIGRNIRRLKISFRRSNNASKRRVSRGGDANVFGTFSAFGSDESTDPNEAFKACHNGCTNLYRGKLYTCSACYVFRANEYFHANHEVPEGWDIYKYSGKELQSFPNKPIPFCRYCHHGVHLKSFPWEVSKRKAEEWM